MGTLVRNDPTNHSGSSITHLHHQSLDRKSPYVQKTHRDRACRSYFHKHTADSQVDMILAKILGLPELRVHS